MHGVPCICAMIAFAKAATGSKDFQSVKRKSRKMEGDAAVRTVTPAPRQLLIRWIYKGTACQPRFSLQPFIPLKSPPRLLLAFLQRSVPVPFLFIVFPVADFFSSGSRLCSVSLAYIVPSLDFSVNSLSLPSPRSYSLLSRNVQPPPPRLGRALRRLICERHRRSPQGPSCRMGDQLP